MEIKYWHDGVKGEDCYVFFEHQGGREHWVFNLFTHETHAVPLGEKIREEDVLRIPFGLGEDFKRAMSNFLQSEGIRPEEESVMKGKLEATKYHLEDLRKLLKLEAKKCSS